MTWKQHNLVQRFDGDFPEPPEYELYAYGLEVPDRIATGRIKHGTATGYVMHLRRSEQPCYRCSRARAAEDARARRVARKKAA